MGNGQAAKGSLGEAEKAETWQSEAQIIGTQKF
jgi:hypothetical protein